MRSLGRSDGMKVKKKGLDMILQDLTTGVCIDGGTSNNRTIGGLGLPHAGIEFAANYDERRIAA